MKIVMMSDIHGMFKKVSPPDGDILIIAGDFLGRGTSIELMIFNNWLETLPHKYKVVVAGNHDLVFEEDPNLAKGILTNAIYLQDSSVEIEGLKIYGSPWQPEFNNYAFNLPRGQALKEKWDQIPSGLDVLITHGPPKGYLDRLVRMNMNNGKMTDERLGCDDLRNAVLDKKPKLHVFGHIHYSHGFEKNDDTLFVNASICTESYKPLNEFIIVEKKDDQWQIVEKKK